MHGRPDDRARRDRRERGAPVDQGGPRLHPEQPRLGGQRLSDRLRRSAAAGGAPRRPARSSARIPGRAGRVYGRLASVRPCAEPGDADRGPLRPGCRRRGGVGGDARDDRHDVPGAAGAGKGDRRVRLRGLGGRLDRAARRRHPHGRHQLALDLLRERSDRDRDGAPRPAPRREPARDRHPGGRGRPRRDPRDGRPDADRLHDPRCRGARLDVGADAASWRRPRSRWSRSSCCARRASRSH